MANESEMIHIGDGVYMTSEEAYLKGFNPRLEKPGESEGFFANGAFWNILFIAIMITASIYLSSFVRSVISGLL